MFCPSVDKFITYALFFMINALLVSPCVSPGQRLRFIEEEVQEQLVEQIRMESESLISYLEGATAELKAAPQDLRDFSKYALRVQKLFKITYLQKSVEYDKI